MHTSNNEQGSESTGSISCGFVVHLVQQIESKESALNSRVDVELSLAEVV